MELSGSLTENLRAAVSSARRLRDQPVYGETLGFWRELLQLAEARREKAQARGENLEPLIAELEAELALR